MTTEAVVQLATPIAIIIAAIVQQYNATRAKKEREEVKIKVAQVADKVASDTTKLDAIGAKADHITQLTNGHLSKVTDELKLANDKIAGMEKMIAALAEGKRSRTTRRKERH